ncbi:hypothetical protein ACLOJK_006580 [Asimina triloba]
MEIPKSSQAVAIASPGIHLAAAARSTHGQPNKTAPNRAAPTPSQAADAVHQQSPTPDHGRNNQSPHPSNPPRQQPSRPPPTDGWPAVRAETLSGWQPNPTKQPAASPIPSPSQADASTPASKDPSATRHHHIWPFVPETPFEPPVIQRPNRLGQSRWTPSRIPKFQKMASVQVRVLIKHDSSHPEAIRLSQDPAAHWNG